MKLILPVASAATFLMFAGPAMSSDESPALTISDYTFEAHGQKIAAEWGELTVPENRHAPGSRRITLKFVRFPATGQAKGTPIVYLSGGPGGSAIATAKGPRFPIFMAMREVGDVIAFDQRGTGASNDIPPCRSDQASPLDEPLTRDTVTVELHEQARKCAAFWKQSGIDLEGYTTEESAADLEDLRKALGAKQLKLWGISYGSHLALATIKRYPSSIERAVLASIEGLDETVKLPALTDAFFARVQAVIDTDPHASKAYPDLAGLIRSVHARLERDPATVTIKDETGREIQLVIGKLDIQLVTSFSISDPHTIARVPAMYAQMDAGDFSTVGEIIYRYIRNPQASTFRGMPEAMDVASGISEARLKLVQEQAKTALLGDALNFPMPHLAGAFEGLDLGDDFRSPVSSSVPTLFISGTLDGRTYPESAKAVAARFSNATHVIVENGGHNIFEAAPEIGKMVVAYMKGRLPKSRTLRLEPPKFIVVPKAGSAVGR